MIDKTVQSPAEAVAGIESGSTILISGFGEPGVPVALIDALVELGAEDLTVVANGAGAGESGIAALFRANRIRKIICSYPRAIGSIWFERRYEAGTVELELVPQGTLSERIRAGGAGIGAFFTPSGVGTQLGQGKETRMIGGRLQVLEYALVADVSLIRADTADRWGNLTYHAAARNFGPTMAAAAALTVVQVNRVVERGDLDPESIITPSLYVDRVVALPQAGVAQ